MLASKRTFRAGSYVIVNPGIIPLFTVRLDVLSTTYAVQSAVKHSDFDAGV
jgi:hypothetical protein